MYFRYQDTIIDIYMTLWETCTFDPS